MANIAIIPARGGSKRIPRKNIRLFFGKPIICYSIKAAKDSGLFDRIIVSTDSEEIGRIAIDYGAEVPFLRSEKNSDDFATTADVLIEVISKIEHRQNIDNICCIYPCAPFVSSKILINAYHLLKEKNFSTVLPIISFSYPIQRAVRFENEGVKFLHPEYENTRSQDLPTYYHDAGQFYWLNLSDFLKTKTILGKNSGAVVISEFQAQDIDNEIDWKIAELKYKLGEYDFS